jgi:hypothetical protein
MGPSTRWSARVPVIWDNLLHNLFGLKQREQYLIRISTNRSLAELTADPLWAKLIAGLAPTGLHTLEGVSG